MNDMGFTKLDEGIVQSSIMNEDGDTFKVWITLLAICREDGVAHCSSTFLSAVCHLDQARVDSILKKFSLPDAESRTTRREGRRIRRVDGGYELINYFKYRESGLRKAEAERKRLYRQQLKGPKCPDISGRCPDSSASASASASSSSKRKRGSGGIRLILHESPKRWEGISDDDKALWAKTYPGCNVETVLQEMIAYWDAQPSAKRKLNWKRTIVNRLKWLQDHGGTTRGTGNKQDDFNAMLDAWAAKGEKP